MSKEITAYLSDDGKIHLKKEDADFADYSGMIAADVTDFLKHKGLTDSDDYHLKMLCEWELWKVGGMNGWLAERTDFSPSPEPAVPAPVKAAKPEKQTAAYKKHLGIVGLFGIHHSSFQKEFGNEFKLTIYDSDCKGKLRNLKPCHKVLVMTKFISHQHVEMLRAVGQEPMMVSGGMDKLRAAITALYVNG